MAQTVISGNGCVRELCTLLAGRKIRKVMLVRGGSFSFPSVDGVIEKLDIPMVSFSGFTPNPRYEEVVKGVELFRRENCDAIVAIGGGSAIDVAKCIKLYCKMDPARNYLEQECEDSEIILVAVPSTGGTGSESTRYAVIYYEGRKQSIAHESIIPDYAFLDPQLLETLPLYQKKCTMLDALCHGIESWWSVNSTDESRQYSKIAVESIMANYKAYIVDGSATAAERMMYAANYAGRAINITQTTAAHAMSYKLTSMYKISHGHAVAVCLPYVWQYMIQHMEKCVDSRGKEYLWDVFRGIAFRMGCGGVQEAISFFNNMLTELGMEVPVTSDEGVLTVLENSVNLIRLKNNPVELDGDSIHDLYSSIVTIR